jgi:hypothetical protein
MRKEEMVEIVQSDFDRWPAKEPWDQDPLAHRAKPTVQTLKRVIVECKFIRCQKVACLSVVTTPFLLLLPAIEGTS